MGSESVLSQCDLAKTHFTAQIDKQMLSERNRKLQEDHNTLMSRFGNVVERQGALHAWGLRIIAEFPAGNPAEETLRRDFR